MAATHVSLLFLFTFLALIQAKLDLDPSDHKALLVIKRDLGIKLHEHDHLPGTTPCSHPGVFCKQRISSNSHVLRITRLVFRSQRLKGFLSPAIGNLSELQEISLPNNQIANHIPPQIANCSKLEVINLRNNGFSGEVPSELSSLIPLKVLDLSSNKFSGELSFLKYFPNLERLSLSNNLFSGEVPTSLNSFEKLRVLDISGNSLLQGPVPIKNVPRRYVLAENSTRRNQTSAVAQAPSNTHSTANATQTPSPSTHKHKKSKRKAIGWTVGFFAGGIAGIISGFIFVVLGKLLLAIIRGKIKDSDTAIFSPLIKKAEDLDFLKNEEGLSSLEIIGRGGCGEVYKAELPGSNGKIIAIKKIVDQPPKDAEELTDEDTKALNKKMRQIKSEIQTVGKIRHRNLVPLLAHVSQRNCHYLVYEFMKNGSLQDVLNRVSEGKGQLDWLARHKIAMGIAAGLEYLHVGHNHRIIHRDLKPANILVDDEMEARITDFGLAKAVPETNTHVTTTNVAGTIGYIAPEYHQTMKFTEKCDIYSYGVLLGTMVMGKLPSDEFFQHTAEVSLVKWMRNVMTSDDPRRAIDPTLLGNGYEEQMLLALKIACFCTLEDPKERPTSKDVRCMLSQIRH